MPQSVKPPAAQNILATALRNSARVLSRLFSGFLFPVSKDLWHVGCAICRPVTRGIVRTMATTVRNLHNKKHWRSRFGTTFWGNAIGLAIAMVSAQLLSNFVEVRGAGNLWGLFSKRTVVSENSYRLVSFIAEFLVTLIVFSVVEHLLDLRARNKQEANSQNDDS